MNTKYIVLIVTTILTLSVTYSIFSVQADDPLYEPQAAQQYVLWTCSDVHLRGDGNGYTTSPSAWSDTIDDAFNTVGANYSICIGDLINWADPETNSNAEVTQAYEYFWNNSGETYGWKDTYTLGTWSNVTIGNHDGFWGPPIPDDIDIQGRWTYELGNVLFIGINDSWSPKDSISYVDGTGWAGRYETYCLDWLNATVQANSDKNILIFCHHPLYNTTWESGGSDSGCAYGTRTMYPLTNPAPYTVDAGGNPWPAQFGYFPAVYTSNQNWNFTDWLNWTNASGYHVDAWVSGHTHTTSHECNFYEGFGTTFISDLKISTSGGSEARESVFWYFEEGNSTVTLKAWNHGTDAWASTAYFPNTLELTYDFTFNPEDNTQFISIDGQTNGTTIDGQTNGTTIYNSTPTFNWTIVSRASMYNLQIANDSTFTDLVVNLVDINEYNYPTKYDKNTTRVSFTLPDVNMLPTYRQYYCRVRALV